MLKDFVFLLFRLHSSLFSLTKMLATLKIITETLLKYFNDIFHRLHVIFIVKKHSYHCSRIKTSQKQNEKRIWQDEIKIIRKFVKNEANDIQSEKKANNQVNINECSVLFLLFIDLINHNIANIEMVCLLHRFLFLLVLIEELLALHNSVQSG